MKSPISYTFIAANAAVQAKGALYRFSPSRKGESPSWEGRGNDITTHNLSIPITDKNFWEGRYALCELKLQRAEDKEPLIINDAIVAINRSKNIVKTQIAGKNGTIKEYISDGDYSINIVVGIVAVKDGIIVDEYPSDGLTQLRHYLDANEALIVHSEFLKIFEIERLVITSFSVTQATESNYQSVSISALSDVEYNIYSTDY